MPGTATAPPTTTIISPFTAPLDFTTTDFVAVQNFAANLRVFENGGVAKHWNDIIGFFIIPGYGNSTFQSTFTDGTSQTIMFATKYANNGKVGSGGVNNCSSYSSTIINPNAGPARFFGYYPLTGPANSSSGSQGWRLRATLANAMCGSGYAQSFGSAGIQVALGDASVRTVSPAVTPYTWNSAMQPNEGNPLGSDW